MISRNRSHPAGSLKGYDLKTLQKQMPKKYRHLLAKVTKSAEGRKALKRYRKFWGLPFPMRIRALKMPGPKNKVVFLVGMGKAPSVQLADGPKGKAKKVWRVKRKGQIAAVDASGRRIVILSGRNGFGSGKKKKFLGFVPETHYVPTKEMEDAGTHKKGRYWIHRMGEEGGTWPKAYEDEAGNVIYDKGSYRVTDWIRD